jgi:hypothetical protein
MPEIFAGECHDVTQWVRALAAEMAAKLARPDIAP